MGSSASSKKLISNNDLRARARVIAAVSALNSSGEPVSFSRVARISRVNIRDLHTLHADFLRPALRDPAFRGFTASLPRIVAQQASAARSGDEVSMVAEGAVSAVSEDALVDGEANEAVSEEALETVLDNAMEEAGAAEPVGSEDEVATRPVTVEENNTIAAVQADAEAAEAEAEASQVEEPVVETASDEEGEFPEIQRVPLDEDWDHVGSDQEAA